MAFISSCIFFFKQKTAYEMRISDLSSDVCSSDLNALLGLIATHPKAALATHEALERTAHDQNHAPLEGQQRPLMQSRTQEAAAPPPPDVRLQVSDQESREPPAGCLGPADCRGSRRSHFSQCQNR